MVFWLLLLLIFGLIGLQMYLNLTYWKRKGIPHDKPHFFFGNLKNWRTSQHLVEILDSIYMKYKGTGPFVGFYFLQRPTVILMDLNLIKNILIKDFRLFFERGTFHNEKDDPLSGHLFRVGGEKWKILRQKLSPTFTSGKMKHMFSTIYNLGLNLHQTFAQKLEEHNNEPQVIEVVDLMCRFTADVIGSCAFGIDCNSLKYPDAEFVRMGRKAIFLRKHCKIIDFLIETYPEMARTLGMKQIHPDIHEFYFRIIRNVIKERAEKQIKKKDCLDSLIEMLDRQEMTIEDVVAQCFVFFVAGFDTSAAAMGFALYELAKNQEVQDKLRREINRVLDEHNQQYTYECMKNMQYLQQVIAETLRLYPSLSQITRKALATYPTDNPKYVIEKGTTIYISLRAIHMDPEYYPNPEVFDPDRFLPEEIEKRPQCSYIPFGDGPRNCIGLRFGKMQSNIGLGLLIKDFKFSLCPETQIPVQLNVQSQLLAAANGIYLKVEKVKTK